MNIKFISDPAMVDSGVDALAQKWLSLGPTMTPEQEAARKPEAYCKDIKLVTVNAKYLRLSRRKQKKVLIKLSSTLLKNAYPISVGGIEAGASTNTAELTVTFSFDN